MKAKIVNTHVVLDPKLNAAPGFLMKVNCNKGPALSPNTAGTKTTLGRFSRYRTAKTLVNKSRAITPIAIFSINSCKCVRLFT